MVVKVDGIGVCDWYPVDFVGAPDVPAHEVDGVVEVVTRGEGAASGRLVFAPGSIQGLAVAIG